MEIKGNLHGPLDTQRVNLHGPILGKQRVILHGPILGKQRVILHGPT